MAYDDIFTNLPQDISNKHMEVNLSGLRAFANVINYAKNYRGRKIGVTSSSKKNTRKVIFNVIQPSEGETTRVPVRNPIDQFLKSDKARERAEELGTRIYGLAIQAAGVVSVASVKHGRKGSYKATGSAFRGVRTIFKDVGEKIKQDIQDEFGNVEPPVETRLEKNTEGLTETGKLKKSIGNRVWGKAFTAGHIARKKARAAKRRKKKNASQFI